MPRRKLNLFRYLRSHNFSANIKQAFRKTAFPNFQVHWGHIMAWKTKENSKGMLRLFMKLHICSALIREIFFFKSCIDRSTWSMKHQFQKHLLYFNFKKLFLKNVCLFQVYHLAEGREKTPKFFDEDLEDHQPFPTLQTVLQELEQHVGCNVEIKWNMQLKVRIMSKM